MRKTGTSGWTFLAMVTTVAAAIGSALAGSAGAAPAATRPATRPSAGASSSASAFAREAVAELLGDRLVMWQRGAPALAPAEEGPRPAPPPPPVARPGDARVDARRAAREARRAAAAAARDRAPEVANRGAGEVPSLARGGAPVRPERPRLAESRRFASVGLTPGPLRIPIAAASGRNRLAAAAAGMSPAVVGPLVGDERGASTFPTLPPFARRWSERLARAAAAEEGAPANQEGDDDAEGAADGIPAPAEDEAGIRLVPVGRDLPSRAPLK